MNDLLEKFNSSYTVQKKEVNNVPWEYYYKNTGKKKTLIFLPGTSAKAITYFQYLASLNQKYNLLAINYPIIPDLKLFVKQISDFIESFDFNTYTLVANSFGALLAQYLIKDYPEKISEVFLINGYTKSNVVSIDTINSHIKSYKKQLHVLNGIYPFLYKSSYKRNIKAMVYSSSIKNKRHWKKFYYDTFNKNDRKVSINVYEALLNFWEKNKFSRLDFVDFEATVHIIKSDVNLSKTKDEYKEVEEIFPNVTVHTLNGNSNMMLHKHFEKIKSIIEKNSQ